MSFPSFHEKLHYASFICSKNFAFKFNLKYYIENEKNINPPHIISKSSYWMTKFVDNNIEYHKKNNVQAYPDCTSPP